MPRARGFAVRTAAALFGAISLASSLAFKLAFAAIAIALPLGAMWIASSLAAHRGGSIAVAVLCGIAVWPVLPVAWELLSTWRRRRTPATRPPVLTAYDRMILRSVAVGLVANGILLLGFPATVFTALASRGDWMLGDRHGPIIDRARDGLMAAAGGLEWLHESTHRNEYRDIVDERATQTAQDVTPSDDTLERAVEEMVETPTPGVAPGYRTRTDAWPFAATLHPAVASMPTDAERSITAVGQHLAAAEPDATLRVKAVHDYVASRIAYDVPAYRAHDIPDQSATTVFARRIGVCAGYAQLATAIGEAAGLEIVVVVGDARTPGEDPSGEGHAWNAARIGDRWVLFDATWDAGAVDGDTFTAEYRTDYLMAPPEVFGHTHFPEDPKWQLVATPKGRAAFVANAAMAPAFHARGLGLRTPSSGHTRVRDELTIVLDNPLGVAVRGDIAEEGARINFDVCAGTEHDAPNVGAASVRCGFPRPGRYHVRLWDGDAYLGLVQVDATR
jgi:hypothetical protein